MNRELRVLSIGQLRDICFHVPSYQRGYRWERRQVRQLLEDISDNRPGKPYYLQPIVVAENEKGYYDIIDGQQRMTTLYLVYRALEEISSIRLKAFNEATGVMKTALGNLLMPKEYNLIPGYEISYETRTGSKDYLNKIESADIVQAKDNPDYLYLWHAYQEIRKWLNDPADRDRVKVIAAAMQEDVRIIWYEIDNNMDCWKKFADLNVGKIPLTNSELIKAVFMRSEDKNSIKENEKDIIVTQWDNIERALADEQFWFFLTNRKPSEFQTRIDLLFNIISGQSKGHDPYSTFQYFYSQFEKKKQSGKWDGKGEWDEIYAQFQLLYDWFNNRKLYHRIGFLITFAGKDRPNLLNRLLAERRNGNTAHSAFINKLEHDISEYITLPDKIDSIKNLDYENHYGLIMRVLTIFNILTMDNMADDSSRYSFNHHKNVGGGWSLEHIHAQNSEDLNRKEQWDTWIMLHLESLDHFTFQRKAENADEEEMVSIKELKAEMQSFLPENAPKSQDWFNRLSRRFSEIAKSAKDSRLGAEYKDEMANMALLGKWDNSVLNNSVFDVKRRLIMNMTESSYVPVCTQRVFMKLYGDQTVNQTYFWGDRDREAYIDVIEDTIIDYLPKGYVKDSVRRKQEQQLNQSNTEKNEQEQ